MTKEWYWLYSRHYLELLKILKTIKHGQVTITIHEGQPQFVDEIRLRHKIKIGEKWQKVENEVDTRKL